MILKNLLSLALASSFLTVAAKEQIPNVSSAGNQIVFLENKGQVTDQYLQPRPDVQFALHLKGMNAFIGKGQIHYQFSKMPAVNNTEQGKKLKPGSRPEVSGPVEMYRLDVELLGANANAKAEVLEQNAYYESYYLPQCGKDGATAHSYGKIVYHDVYPHIDWVLKIKNGQPEYEFVVKAGGKPSDIRIKYNGATGIKLNADGSLTASTPMGTVTEDAPYTFQQDGGTVNSSFKLNDNVLSFNVAAYTGTLTIDPSLVCATYYGGSGQDNFVGLKYDGQYLYLLGQASSTTNITSIGAYQTSYAGGIGDVMIVKMDTALTTRVWGTYYGGSGDEYPEGIAYDGSANIYITGYTSSTNGISTAASFQAAYGGGANDGFLAKFSSAGARVWATYYGGGGSDVLIAVDVDGTGKINVGGDFGSASMASAGAYQTIMSGTSDAFIAQFNNAGAKQWSTYYGGPDDDAVLGICHNSSNEIYIAGATLSVSGIASAGSHQQTFGGGFYDGLIAKFNSTGTTRIWGTYYGGTSEDYNYGIACDGSGNVYSTGYTASSNAIASPGAYQDVFQGGTYDAFLTKFNSSGARQWATYMGGTADEICYSVATDASSVYMFGESSSTSGLATAGSYQEFNLGFGGYDNFIEKFDFNGTIAWGTYYGSSSGNDYCGLVNGMCLGSTGNMYIAGYTDSYNDLSTPGTYQTANNGIYNGLVAKFNGCQSLAPPVVDGTPLLCRNSSGTFTVNNLPGATTYYWSIPAGWTGTSNTNSITIGVNTTSGYIHVYATDGCGFSPIDSQYIEVEDPQVDITANGPTTFCGGGSVELDNIDPVQWGSYFQWQQNNVDIPSANLELYDATASGNYRVIMTLNGCNDTSNTISVTVNPSPTAAITPGGPTTFCTGGQVILSTPTGPGYTYQWKLNTLTIPGATNSSYTATADGDYSVVTTLATCKDTSAYETVTVETAPPLPLSNVSGVPTPCANVGSYNYSTNNNPGSDYFTWTLPPGWTGASTSSSITVTTSTNSGNVTVTASNACGTTSPVSLPVTVIDAQPVTNISGNVISTTATFDTYQWYLDGSPIPGATSQNYTMLSFGTYKVFVTKSSCQGVSADVHWPPLGVSATNAAGMEIYMHPNPNNGVFTLSGSTAAGDSKLDILVTDLAGRVILKDAFAISGGIVNKQVTMPGNVPAGLYILKATTQSGNVVIPFTKQ